MMIYDKKIYSILVQRKEIIKNTSIILIILFIFIIILTILFGKKERIGYLSDFNLISSKNGQYTYDFRIKYYSKIFTDNDIYNVYLYYSYDKEIMKNNSFIKYFKIKKYGEPYGTLISTKELKYDDKIDNIKYYLLVKFDIFFYIAILFILILLFFGFYLLKEYWKYKQKLEYKDYLFVNKIEILAICLFVFKIWLFYPGCYFITDIMTSSLLALLGANSGNWHPILLELNIKLADKLGLTMGIFFIINTILLYLSLFFIVISLYFKYKNKNVIFLFLISFILSVFINSISYLKDYVSTLYVFFSYSIVLMIIVLNIENKTIKNILKFISLITLIIGMLHRHNFIVTVYPIFIWFTYDYLKSKNIQTTKKYIFYFISIMFINAIVLMGIFFIFPKLFIKQTENGQFTQSLYMQIAGTLVPANDGSVIPIDLYKEGKQFQDIINGYKDLEKEGKFYLYKNLWLQSGDFLYKNNEDYAKIFFKTIMKHPIYYIKFIYNFTKEMWTAKTEIPLLTSIHMNNDKIKQFAKGLRFTNRGFDVNDVMKLNFYENNRGIYWTKLRENMYNFLIKVLPDINIFIFVLTSIILFFISGLFILLKKYLVNDILIFTFATSFSAFATAIINVIFIPNLVYRYIYPVLLISIISLIGFIIFIYDIGGVKKLIKELKTNNKQNNN